MRAVIVANGHIEDYGYYRNQIKENDYIICADGAIRHCMAIGIMPDLWVGDFDSCDYENYCMQYPNLKNVQTKKLCPQKDETDTHIACLIAIEKGYTSIVIFGAIGSRVDHMLTSIHLLEMLLETGVDAVIENEKNTICMFNKTRNFKNTRKYLSLIPIDKTVVVKKTDGLLYNLQDYPLKREISMGVSNEIITDVATVSIKSGVMLAIQSDD